LAGSELSLLNGADVGVHLINEGVLGPGTSPGTAIIALAVAVNGIGLILWEHRDRIRPYLAIETLIAVVGCAAFVVFALLDGTSSWGLAGTPASGERPPYAVLLVFPAMMVMFAVQEPWRDARAPSVPWRRAHG
jgi:hypothetical protein